jgi:hypothetical protein
MAATSGGVKASFGAHLTGGIDGLSQDPRARAMRHIDPLEVRQCGLEIKSVRVALAITTYQRAGADGIETSRRRTFASWTGPQCKDQDVSE